MTDKFTPPYPIPHKTKSAFFKRIFRAWDSWIHVVYEKSYTLKLGEVNMPNVDMFVAGEPHLVDTILSNKNNKYPKHQHLAKLLKPLMGDSVFTTNGEIWAEQRSMLRNAFGQTHLKRSFDDMCSAADNLICMLDKKRGISSTFDVEPFMTHVAADIIYRTIFSQPLSEEDSSVIYHSFHRFQISAQRAFILRLYSLPSFWHNKVASREALKIRHTFSRYLNTRHAEFSALSDSDKNKFVEKDILDSLLNAKHPKTQKHFNLEQIIDQLGVFFIAGHETSATALTWALYLVAKTPDLQHQLQQEIDQVVEQNKLRFEDIKRLKKLNFVFQETLRLYPPVAFLLREASCDMEIRKKQIKKGSVFSISPWLIQRSSNHWKNPHEFEPFRFDSSNTQAQQRCPVHDKSLKQAYLPFGGGERICMGAAFAQQEFIIVMCKIIQNFEFSYIDNSEPQVISRVTTRPKDGIHLQFTKR